MDNILIIGKSNPKDYSTVKDKVIFIIGGVGVKAIEDKLIEILKSQDYLREDDLVFKYDGIELNIVTQNIPNIVKLLSELIA